MNLSSGTLLRIEDSTPFHTGTGWISALLCFGAAGGILFWLGFPPVVDTNSPEFNPAVFVPVVLAVVGVVQLVNWLRGRAVARRFGVSVFEMEGPRLAIGGTLRGRVLTSRDLTPAAGYRLRLCCTETFVIPDSVASKTGRLDRRARFEARSRVDQVASSSGAGVPVEIALPRKPIEPVSLSRKIEWTLEIEAEIDGSRYRALFGIPVAN